MTQPAVWIPPSLCGCKLRIHADWVEGSIVDGISYRHPKAFTIESVHIISVCLQHQPNTLFMPSILGLYEVDNMTGSMVQRRGYLTHPIINPSPAQCLYQFLSQYGGQRHSYPCGCSGHQFVDENKNVGYLEHPINSQKCHAHKSDSHDMVQAKIDFDTAIETSKTTRVADNQLKG